LKHVYKNRQFLQLMRIYNFVGFGIFLIVCIRIFGELNITQSAKFLLFAGATLSIGSLHIRIFRLLLEDKLRKCFFILVFGVCWVAVITALLPKISNGVIFGLALVGVGLGRKKKNEKRVKAEKSVIGLRSLCQILFGFLGTSAIFLVSILTWQIWNPIKLSENQSWRYQTDVAFIDSISSAIAINGNTHTHFSQNDKLDYHWIAYAFIGKVNDFASLPPIIMAQWIFPLFILLCAFLLFGDLERPSQNSRANIKKSIYLSLIAGPGFEIGSLLTLQSPSTLLSIPLGIATIVIFGKVIEDGLSSWSLNANLCFLIFFLVGTKGSTAVVVYSAFLIFGFYFILQKENCRRLRYVLIARTIGLLTASFAIGYIFFIQARTSFPLSFRISLNSLSILPLCIMFYLLIIRVHALNNVRENRLVLSFCLVLSGSVLSLFTSHSSGNEVWFIYAGFGLGLSLLMVHIPLQSHELVITKLRKRCIALAVFLSTCLVSVWKLVENLPSTQGKIMRSLIELIIPLIYLFLVVMKKIVIRVNQDRLNSFFLLLILFSSCFTILTNFFLGPIYSQAKSNFGYGEGKKVEWDSVTAGYYESGDWVRSNTKKTALFITNRLCDDSESNVGYCKDIWAYGSALTSRNFYLEAPGYVYKTFGFVPSAQFLNESDLIGYRFLTTPSLEYRDKLLDLGVEWIWLEKKSTFSTEIYRFAEIRYTNSDIDILKIHKK
jgi:hypothetical protein